MGAPGSYENLEGRVYGRLTVGHTEVVNKVRLWSCACSCGNVVLVQGGHLRKGTSKSCGCLQKELSSVRHTTHGMWKNKHPLYGIWNGMKNRCNLKHKNYSDRGISYHPDWKEFQPFHDWAISNGYEKGLTIERKDYNGNYEPSNCTWISMSEQPHNKRDNVFFEYKGEMFALKDLVPDPERRKKVRLRLWYKWSVERAVETP